jgi:hypothetical protein
LRLGRGREDRAFIGPQNLQPRLNVFGVVFARFRAQSEMRANERGPEFRYQFFSGIGVIAEALA